MAVCRALRGLPVGFLLLRYSVLFTVESLSLLYLLIISWFICSRRWCIDKLGVYHANQTSVIWLLCIEEIHGGSKARQGNLCVLINIWTKGEVGAPFNRFKPSSKIFYWPFQGGTSFVDLLCFFSVLCLLCLCMRLFICALWSPAGKGLTSWLSFVVSNCPIDILGQVWYLIVSIPDLCTPTYFPYQQTIMGYLCPPAKSHLNGVSLADRYSPVFFKYTHWVTMPACSATETRQNLEILHVASLRHCCSRAIKFGFLAIRPNYRKSRIHSPALMKTLVPEIAYIIPLTDGYGVGI